MTLSEGSRRLTLSDLHLDASSLGLGFLGEARLASTPMQMQQPPEAAIFPQNRLVDNLNCLLFPSLVLLLGSSTFDFTIRFNTF